MSPEPEESNPHSQQQNPEPPRQEVIASEGATIKDVVQAIISGKAEGDVVFGDKIYLRSEVEELNDYLDWAVAEFENRMSQILLEPSRPGTPFRSLDYFTVEDASIYFGRRVVTAEAVNRFCQDGARNKKNCASVEDLLRWSLPKASVKLNGYEILDNEMTFAQYQQCVDEGKWDPARANIEHDQVDTVKSVLQFAETDVSVYGVKSMAGNVQEWTATEISFVFEDMTLKQKSSITPLSIEEAKKRIEEARPQIEEALKKDPSADPSNYYPVVSIRGGSWDGVRSLAFASQHRPDSIGRESPEIGFRCVCPNVGKCITPWDWWWTWFSLN